MKSKEIKKIVDTLPDSPGVYFFVRNSKILYIGKATSLRDRVKSYFSSDILNTRGPLIHKMLSEFNDIEFQKTDSVLEALVLEAYLIKKHQPDANIKEKDNRSFNFVVITSEKYPRVSIARSRELLKTDSSYAYSFGPFPNGSQLKEALKIIRKMFPYRDDKCVPASEQKDPKNPKPCFNYQIGLCPGVCMGTINKEDYKKIIENIVLFFEGNKMKLVKNLEKQMEGFAKNREFEKANLTKRTLFILNHIQDVSLIKDELFESGPSGKTMRIESYDIAHMAGQNVVGVMTVVEDGEVKISEYRRFKIRSTSSNFLSDLGIVSEDPKKNTAGGTNSRMINDTKALSEVLSRRLAHIEWKFPDLIVVDGGVAQKNAIQKILKNYSYDIPVVSVVKDERHKPREILGDKKWLKYEREIILSNSEAHRYGIAYHKKLRRLI